MLTVIYLVIALSPLAPLAMHSKVVAHAVTGECSGDCDICGCSLESRANHICCCAKKKQQQAGVAKLPSAGGCCSPKSAIAPTPAKGSCCAVSQPLEPVVAKNDCCAKNKQHQHDENVQEPQDKEQRSKNETVYKCGCPCGKGKLLALTGFGSNELLPINLIERTELPHVATIYADLSHRLASRHGEPPDPPPRLISLIS
jgi:hypothetical protein